jgi:gliding motility-associated-like protein
MDGVNDYLYPLNAYKATNLLFRVFDRVGHVVFETKDWTRKWDGTYKNSPQPTGVYIWMLDYNDAANKRVSTERNNGTVEITNLLSARLKNKNIAFVAPHTCAGVIPKQEKTGEAFKVMI